MGILLLLPFLVSGYWICLKHPRLALGFHRYEGQLLYLLVAREGIICFLIASVLSLLLGLLRYVSFTVPIRHGYQISLDYLSSIETWLLDHQLVSAHNADIGTFLVQAAVLCLVVPKMWASFAEWRLKYAYNLSTRAELDTHLLAQFVDSDPRLELLMTSIRHPQNRYLFTMQDRKVYVGNVISIGKATEAQGIDQHFLLVPLLSGYRDKDTLQVAMTTDYASSEHSVIMLSQENIVSVMLWREEVWEAFKMANKSSKLRPKFKDSLPKR